MKNKVRFFLFWTILSIFFLLSMIIDSTCDWFNIRFGVSFEEILFTIASPLNGSDVSFLNEAVSFVLSSVAFSLVFLIFALFFAILLKYVVVELKIRIIKANIKIQLYKLYQFTFLIVVLALCFSSVRYAFTSLDLGTYIARKMDRTTIYEDYYVNPQSVTIKNSDTTKNLIYIYLESMETTYASTDVGGFQEINYIPHLTELATENISFSHNDVLGGANVSNGGGWTMAALLCTTTGVPFSFPVDGNSMNNYEGFAPGLTSIGDILAQYGYTQTFLCGSDGNFAGRKKYFQQHGNYNVIDYLASIEKGYIPSDYAVWWGYEDQKLYEIAKTELLELSKQDTPFNFTMLTVDTHHVDGYVCEICENTYPDQLANILQCADNQVYNFINWCKEQDFYEDTVIIVTGDHFRMDSSLVAGSTDRKVYNCFINSQKEPANNIKNRTFTMLDFFPTTLSALGFDIEGNRLGLGTDLFSDSMTLAEELGYDFFNNELGKYSDYYVANFE